MILTRVYCRCTTWQKQTIINNIKYQYSVLCSPKFLYLQCTLYSVQQSGKPKRCESKGAGHDCLRRELLCWCVLKSVCKPSAFDDVCKPSAFGDVFRTMWSSTMFFKLKNLYGNHALLKRRDNYNREPIKGAFCCTIFGIIMPRWLPWVMTNLGFQLISTLYADGQISDFHHNFSLNPHTRFFSTARFSQFVF